MNAADAVLRMIGRSGKTKSGISSELGKTRNFVTSSISQAEKRGACWNPQVDTFIALAKCCGYSVVIKGRDEEIELE